MKVWQIATGETGRDYRELFFDYDIMILGPSHLGDALSNDYSDGIPSSKGNQVHNFAHRPEPKDRVLMRFGREVIGVGQIPSAGNTYSFEDAFKCVYGWDLCHCRRVIWATDYSLKGLTHVYEKAKQKPSFTRVHEPHIVKMVSEVDDFFFDRPLKKMANIDSSRYSDDELGIELFRAGISHKNIEDIVKALRQADRLYSWYKRESCEDRWKNHCGRNPTEHEIVSHMILPVFLGLGWSHQQIAVEWNRIDMAFFKQTPTIPKNCAMVLEAKGLGNALSEVLEQPIKYVRDLGLGNVKYILSTDGANLFVYEKSGGEWSTAPIGYLSIWSLQKQYILPKETSLIDTLVRLQPSAV